MLIKSTTTVFGSILRHYNKHKTLPQTQNIKSINYNLNLITHWHINIKIAFHGGIVLPL